MKLNEELRVIENTENLIVEIVYNPQNYLQYKVNLEILYLNFSQNGTFLLLFYRIDHHLKRDEAVIRFGTSNQVGIYLSFISELINGLGVACEVEYSNVSYSPQ